MDTNTNSQIIAQLNDLFRKNLPMFMLGGQAFITRGVAALPENDRVEILTKVQNFSDFTEDNDPYGEHDFGSFKQNGETVFWKFDYYDKTMKFGSEDPSDPKQTRRILTIMLANEY